MSTNGTYLTFYIVLTDPEKVKSYQALWPLGVPRAPYNPHDSQTGQPGGAAIEFQAPFRGYTDPNTGAPYTWTPWSGVGTQGGPYPLDVATFQRHTGGFLGIGGTTTRYYWIGQFVLASNPTQDTSGGTPNSDAGVPTLAKIHWLDGFETPGLGPFGFATTNNMIVCRDASRHVGGFGLAMRTPTGVVNIPITKYGTNTDNQIWQRFYIRLRRKPIGLTWFWRTKSDVSGAVGYLLGITANGDLVSGYSDAASNYTVLSTVTTLPLWDGVGSNECWVRLDVLCGHGNGGGNNRIQVYVNDTGHVSDLAAPASNMGTNKLISTDWGYSGGPANNELEIDIDDVVERDIPTNLLARDLLNGTKIVRIGATGFGSNNNAAWTGDYSYLNQQLMGTSATAVPVSSSTSGAILEIGCDDDLQVDADKGQIGVNGVLVCAQVNRGGGTLHGSLGYILNAGSPVDAVLGTSEAANTRSNVSVLYPGQTGVKGVASSPFADLTRIKLRYTHAAEAVAASVSQLVGQVELIGTFSKVDIRSTEAPTGVPDAPIFMGQHNHPYPRSEWAIGGKAPAIAPYIIKAGSYVGNGTAQDLAFRAPVNFIYIRPNGASAQGACWFTGMASSHRMWETGATSAAPSKANEDPNFAAVSNMGDDHQQQQYLLRIMGSDAGINAIGTTYNYIAVMDPGARFMLNGGYAHASTLLSGSPSTGVDLPLINPSFTPEFAFLYGENYGNNTTLSMLAKGPGNAANGVVKWDGVTTATGLAFGAGKLTTFNALHTLLGSEYYAYSLWRRADGNNDPGQDGVVALGTWTGDGNASRSVSTGKTTGKRPILVIVTSEAAAAVVRDFGHTSTNSQTSAQTNSTTGITAGVADGFSVGSTLNANGVVYNYFMLLGDATAGNGGFGVAGEYIPVEAAAPTDGPVPNGPADPADLSTQPGETGTVGTDTGGTGGGLTTDTADDFGAACLAASTSMANMALARIGITKRVTNLDTSTEYIASLVQLLYPTAVTETLRDFPWPFATRYATLVLVAGSVNSPVNADWTFSYRRPTDCVFERRIVVARGNAVNPAAPPFALGTDSGGGLIYTNQASAVLEYTGRGSCVASEGDALFRDALLWRLAALLAPPLTRMADKEEKARQNYELAIEKARSVLQPGKPGAVAPTLTLDTINGASAANLAVVNRALVRIGAQTIAAFTEQSREAVAAVAIFEDELKSALRDYPWAFATKYNAALTLVGGDATTPVNGDWQYSYRLPADCVFVRRLVTDLKRAYEPNPTTFRTVVDAAGGLLFTDDAAPTIEYTARVDGTVVLADALFRDAFAWRLAASLAPSVAQVDPVVTEQRGRGPQDPAEKARVVSPAALQQLRARVAQNAWAMYEHTLAIAKATTANEQQQNPDGDADWISGRN